MKEFFELPGVDHCSLLLKENEFKGEEFPHLFYVESLRRLTVFLQVYFYYQKVTLLNKKLNMIPKLSVHRNKGINQFLNRSTNFVNKELF